MATFITSAALTVTSQSKIVTEEEKKKNEEKETDGDKKTMKAEEEKVLSMSEYPELKFGRDFELVYTVKAPQIQVHAISKSDPEDPEYSEMAVFVTPMEKPQGTFPRAFFFLLDRSGSMKGEAFSEASRALFRVLDKYVRTQDVFNVCVFDHRQYYFKEKFVKGNKTSTGQCKLWIQSMQPEKGTLFFFFFFFFLYIFEWIDHLCTV